MLKSHHIAQEYFDKWEMKIPDGRFRLHNTEEVANPKDADVVVFSMPMRDCTPPVLDPHVFSKIVDDLGVDQRRIALFDCSDDTWNSIHTDKINCMFIRCNMRPWWVQQMPNGIPWFWPVENYQECVDLPDGGFKYDVSARMWLSTYERRSSCESLKDGLVKADMECYTDFTGYIYYQEEGIRRRKEFRRSMKESRLALCPQSIKHVFPYRFYEAMSAGRMAVLICDGAQFPFANKIDYDKCMLRISDGNAPAASSIIREFLNKTSDAELIERGKYARSMWEQWLNRDKQEALFAMAIEEKLRQNGLYTG